MSESRFKDRIVGERQGKNPENEIPYGEEHNHTLCVFLVALKLD